MMTVSYPHYTIPPSSPRFNTAVEKLSRLQTELMSDVLRRAVDDAGAAMKHELSEPLTALMLYLHEIKQVGAADVAGSAPTALSEIVDRALCETERVCNIIEQAGKVVEAPVGAEAAIARGRDAIDSWRRNGRVKVGATGSPAPRANAQPLTPREQEVLALIVNGSSNKEGGYRLGISTRTFEAHRAHLMAKLGARNAADLTRTTLTQNRDV